MENNLEDSVIFDRGEITPYRKYFSGISHLNMLTLEGVITANVTFEPGCINNWHIHKADKAGGQILLVTGGRGWYQEFGKKARELHAGNVVHIPPGIKHWHGASKNSWFVHIAIEIPGENSSNEWLEPVDRDYYNRLSYIFYRFSLECGFTCCTPEKPLTMCAIAIPFLPILFIPTISSDCQFVTVSSSLLMSLEGGAPNKRLYSRLNCEGLS